MPAPLAAIYTGFGGAVAFFTGIPLLNLVVITAVIEQPLLWCEELRQHRWAERRPRGQRVAEKRLDIRQQKASSSLAKLIDTPVISPACS